MHDHELLKSLIELIGRVQADKAELPAPMLEKIHEVLIKVVDDEQPSEAPKNPRAWNAQTGVNQAVTKTPKDEESIKQLMDAGVSEREAHQAHGLHRTYTHPSQNIHEGSEPSDAMLPLLQKVAAARVKQYERRRGSEADHKKNPDIHARQHLHDIAHETHGEIHQKRQDFLDSIAHLPRFDRHQATSKYDADQRDPNVQKQHNAIHQKGEEQVLQNKKEAQLESLQQEQDVLDAHKIDPARGQTSTASSVADTLGVGREDDKPMNVTTIDPSAKHRSFLADNPELAAEGEKRKQANAEKISQLKEQLPSDEQPEEQDQEGQKDLIQRLVDEGKITQQQAEDHMSANPDQFADHEPEQKPQAKKMNADQEDRYRRVMASRTAKSGSRGEE